MALIDSAREVVVIRIVYDGPPSSGKTTSLQALHTALKTSDPVFSPEEKDGHTQFFDWLDYTGGSFRGRSIACQIISVPGLPAFHERRRELLAGADAVVFVADTQASELALGLEYFQDLQSVLQTLDSPPPVLIQANKQDLPGALDEDALQLFFPESLRITPTVATEQHGVREVFVVAVSQAVSRLQKMLDNGANLFGSPEIRTGQDLLEQLRDRPCTVEEADLILETILQTEVPAAQAPYEVTGVEPGPEKSLAPPAADIPGAWVFPAGSGRAMLEQLAGTGMILQRQSDGAWMGRDQATGWRCSSRAEWCYAGEADALQALRAQVRTHIRLGPVLSDQRAVAIDSNGQGQWRLWQITRSQKVLSQAFNEALQQTSVSDFARGMVACANNIYQAFKLLGRYAPHLPATLESIGMDATPVYVGLVDAPPEQLPASKRDAVLRHVREIVAEPIGFALAENNLNPREVLRAVEVFQKDAPQAVAILSELFTPYLRT